MRGSDYLDIKHATCSAGGGRLDGGRGGEAPMSAVARSQAALVTLLAFRQRVQT
jgi:hypothetical protein